MSDLDEVKTTYRGLRRGGPRAPVGPARTPDYARLAADRDRAVVDLLCASLIAQLRGGARRGLRHGPRRRARRRGGTHARLHRHRPPRRPDRRRPGARARTALRRRLSGRDAVQGRRLRRRPRDHACSAHCRRDLEERDRREIGPRTPARWLARLVRPPLRQPVQPCRPRGRNAAASRIGVRVRATGRTWRSASDALSRSCRRSRPAQPRSWPSRPLPHPLASTGDPRVATALGTSSARLRADRAQIQWAQRRARSGSPSARSRDGTCRPQPARWRRDACSVGPRLAGCCRRAPLDGVPDALRWTPDPARDPHRQRRRGLMQDLRPDDGLGSPPDCSTAGVDSFGRHLFADLVVIALSIVGSMLLRFDSLRFAEQALIYFPAALFPLDRPAADQRRSAGSTRGPGRTPASPSWRASSSSSSPARSSASSSSTRSSCRSASRAPRRPPGASRARSSCSRACSRSPAWAAPLPDPRLDRVAGWRPGDPAGARAATPDGQARPDARLRRRATSAPRSSARSAPARDGLGMRVVGLLDDDRAQAQPGPARRARCWAALASWPRSRV